MEPQGNCLQAIKSLRTRAIAETSTCIVAPSDYPQAIKLSSPQVIAGRPLGIEVSNSFAIRLLSNSCSTLIIEFIISMHSILIKTININANLYLIGISC